MDIPTFRSNTIERQMQYIVHIQDIFHFRLLVLYNISRNVPNSRTTTFKILPIYYLYTYVYVYRQQ